MAALKGALYAVIAVVLYVALEDNVTVLDNPDLINLTVVRRELGCNHRRQRVRN